MAVNRELSNQVVNALDDVTKTCDQVSKLMESQKHLIQLIRKQLIRNGDVSAVSSFLLNFETMLQQEAIQAQKMYDQIHKLNSAL